MSCVPLVLRAKSAFSNIESDKVAELERQVHNELEALTKEFSKQAA